ILETGHAADLKAALRSRRELPRADTDVYVADTLGELGLIYRLAPIVFVGGSLATHGGQNPIEPIKLGAAVLHGPNVWNFAEIYAALDKAHGAGEVSDAEGLAPPGGARSTGAPAPAAGAPRPRGTPGPRARAAAARGRRARTLCDADSLRIPRVPCVSRRSGGARPPSRPPCSRRWRRSTARWRARALADAAAMPARRWSASGISPSAAPARRR